MYTYMHTYIHAYIRKNYVSVCVCVCGVYICVQDVAVVGGLTLRASGSTVGRRPDKFLLLE